MKRYNVALNGSVVMDAFTIITVAVPDGVTEDQVEKFAEEILKYGDDVPTEWRDRNGIDHDGCRVGEIYVARVFEADDHDDTDMKLNVDNEGELVEAVTGSGVDHE